MAVQISESFQLYANAPLDSRTVFATVEDMKLFPTTRLYDGIISIVTENNNTYQYFSKNAVDSVTGKWKLFGEGSASGISVVDSYEDLPADGDSGVYAVRLDSIDDDGNIIHFSGFYIYNSDVNEWQPFLGDSAIKDEDINNLFGF